MGVESMGGNHLVQGVGRHGGRHGVGGDLRGRLHGVGETAGEIVQIQGSCSSSDPTPDLKPGLGLELLSLLLSGWSQSHPVLHGLRRSLSHHIGQEVIRGVGGRGLCTGGGQWPEGASNRGGDRSGCGGQAPKWQRGRLPAPLLSPLLAALPLLSLPQTWEDMNLR